MDESEKVESGQRLVVTTGAMAYGPHAVARAAGKVVFVRGAAPDEEVEVVVREDRRTFAYADLRAVVRPSAVRRSPPCRFLPACGGCPWQHIDYPAQLEAKRAIIREQLRRIGGIEVPVAAVLASPHEYAYRRRLKLRVENGELGFYAANSHVLVPIDHCLLAEASVDAAIEVVGELVRQLETRVRRIEIIRVAAAPVSGAEEPDKTAAIVAAGEAEGGWQPADEARCAAWLAANPSVRGLALGGRRWARSWGDTQVEMEPQPGLTLGVDARSFTQVNPAANHLLVETVLRFVDPSPGQSVLELFAGAGNFSVPLARRGATVTAVEAHRQAADDARRNAAKRGNSYQVLTRQAEVAVAELAKRGTAFDVALLDPPRSGATAVLAPLLRLRPRRIVYVSCDPATLARDLSSLSAAYQVDAVQPLDMFPHSYHVETVVHATSRP